MTLVRFVGDYTMNLKNLSPTGDGCWDGIHFTNDPEPEVDYLISLNYPTNDIQAVCPREHCWALIQEPPTNRHHYLHTSHPGFSRVFSCHEGLSGPHRILTHPHLPWYVGRSLQEMESAPPLQKTANLSAVTSSESWLRGHRERLEFLRRLRKAINFDWFGRGIHTLEDKWDGLAPYRYSLALENSCYPFYWSEKIADCFLAQTMPIYSGSPRITEYFPADSMIRIDLRHPDETIEVIRKTVESDRYEKNLQAIREARALVLHQYNPLSFLAREIRQHSNCGCSCKPEEQQIEGRTAPVTLTRKLGFVLKFQAEKWLNRPVPIPGL